MSRVFISRPRSWLTMSAFGRAADCAVRVDVGYEGATGDGRDAGKSDANDPIQDIGRADLLMATLAINRVVC
jgi:hypothetical protein